MRRIANALAMSSFCFFLAMSAAGCCGPLCVGIGMARVVGQEKKMQSGTNKQPSVEDVAFAGPIGAK